VRNFLLISVLFLCCPSLLTGKTEKGGYPGQFLRMGLGARAIGMGGAFVSVADDGYAVYYNPAGLSGIQNRTISLGMRFLSLDRTFGFLGYAQHLGPSAGIGFGLVHAGVDDIERRDVTGIPFGNIPYSENAFYFWN